MGSLYRSAQEYEAMASELCDRIEEAKPATIAGAIALLEWGVDNSGVEPEIRDHVVVGLRVIAERERLP